MKLGIFGVWTMIIVDRSALTPVLVLVATSPPVPCVMNQASPRRSWARGHEGGRYYRDRAKLTAAVFLYPGSRGK